VAGDWSDAQNAAIVADHFAMLADDVAGRPYSKAGHNRLLQPMIGRPRASIEYEHRNISAVPKGLGEDWIPGYKPAFNYQASLEDAVVRWLGRHPDWLAPAARLGRAGEERVLVHERASLRAAGRTDLAERIRWVSHLDGDGAGYDILSFDSAGRDRLIDVQTTNGWERTPFPITRNELAVAEERRSDWHLMRLWNFAREPKAFELRPPLEAHLSLMATGFQASFP
jgi:hypothetical protein